MCLARLLFYCHIFIYSSFDSLQRLHHVQPSDLLLEQEPYQHGNNEDKRSGNQIFKGPGCYLIIHAVSIGIEHKLQKLGSKRRPQNDAKDGEPEILDGQELSDRARLKPKNLQRGKFLQPLMEGKD